MFDESIFIENAQRALAGLSIFGKNLPTWANKLQSDAIRPVVTSVDSTPDENNCRNGTEIFTKVSFVPSVVFVKDLTVELHSLKPKVYWRDSDNHISLDDKPEYWIGRAMIEVPESEMGFVVVSMTYRYGVVSDVGWRPIPMYSTVEYQFKEFPRKY